MSRQWYPMFGYKPTEKDVPLSEWVKYVHPDDLADSEQAFTDFITAGGKGQFESEMRIRRADGTWCWVLSRGRTVTRDSNGKPERIIGLHLDIQKLKDSQKLIEENEENFRKLFQYAPIPMAILSLDGTVVDVNDRLSDVMGYASNDIETIDQWWLMVYPDPIYREEVRAAWQSAIDKAMSDGSGLEARERRVICKDGTERIMIIEATVIGEKLLVSFYDMTDYRKAEEEREKLHEQLLQAQKLEAVGVLAGGVAHDFNNMIAVIMGYSEMILGKMEKENPLHRYQQKILDAAKRSADLTRQLLAFARKQTVAPVTLDLNEAVESMLKLLRRLIGENINLAWLPGKGLCSVRIDPSQFDQILANLCVNARDAIADVGTITIETKNVIFDQAYCNTHPDSKPGEFVLLAVSDDGAGMNKDTLNHIFEPFFTTKDLGQGTGMGLATAYGVVKQNNGFINVYSEPGQGTTFRIYLPGHSEQAVEKQVIIDEKIPAGKGETLLLVEDDLTLLEMTRVILENLGYTVLTAKTPGEAIGTTRDFKGEIHLFVTDVIMPEMNGRDLSGLLQGIRPGTRTLFMSGYTANVIVHQGVLDKGVHFIQKPFSEKELAVKIRSVLD